ncbi:MAG: DNA polymerase III subunit gamma/tau, partial [Clostridia bacterium]|nr:DNA polymerase III subunit gamma/tau [Clostridia bacterium]
CFACKAIDSGAATDVLEIAAASNNGVDDIRDLRDEVIYPPSVLKKRVYIIDEVHMLSSGAFNALLKTLEEPPEYIVFILATTELSRLPATIISRCVRFDFQRIPEPVISDRIRFVSSQESIGIDDDAADLLARLADGAMRDGLSILEAVSTGVGPENRITAESVEERVGLAGADLLESRLRALFSRKTPEALDILDRVYRSSKDLSVFLDDLGAAARDLLVMTEMKRARVRSGGRFRYQKEELRLLEEFEEILTPEYLTWMCGVLEDTMNRLTRYGTDAKIRMDLMIVRLCDPRLSDSGDALLSRVSLLERAVDQMKRNGVPAGKPENPTGKEPAPESPEKPVSESPAEAGSGETPSEPKPDEKPEPDDTPEDPVKAEPEPETGAAGISEPEADGTDRKEEPEKPKDDGFLPFGQTAELLEEMSNHPDLVPFLAKSTLLSEGETMLIRSDTFSIQFLQFGRYPSFLKEALKNLTGADWTLRFEPFEAPKQGTLFDELTN